jgi:hypothetical protein
VGEGGDRGEQRAENREQGKAGTQRKTEGSRRGGVWAERRGGGRGRGGRCGDGDLFVGLCRAFSDEAQAAA